MSKIIKLGQYKGIEVEVKKLTVSNEEVEQQITSLLNERPLMIEKDGEVENGDITTIDFEGFKDGVAFDGGKAENYQLEIGSGQFIPGFEDQMIGMKKGETRELNLTFPENYGAKDLAGADVVFKVTVHKIENKKEAELNEEFIQSLGVEQIKTVEDLKETLKSSLQAQKDQQYATEVENKVMDKLLADCDIEVSEEEINIAKEHHIQHLSMQLASQGMALEQYLQMIGMDMETLNTQLEPSAKQQAIFEAVIDEIVRVENITTSDEEANQQVEELAKANNVTKEQVLAQIQIETLKHDLNRVKASQTILQTAIISE
jgi:trigger factor